MKYKLIDHTADFGFQFKSPTLEDLFGNGALILSELLIDIGSRKPDLITKSISVDGDDYVDLIVKWLGEILFLFDCEHIAVRGIEVESVSPTNITAKVFMFKIDIDNDTFVHDLKAITFHQAKVKKTKNGWAAQIICDM